MTELHRIREEHHLKCIKDPVYGYIRIPVSLLHDIVDKPAFQRLRYIIQAGYTALFPSSTHNRFVHSLGVYYLGCRLARNIKSHLSDDDKARFEKYLDVFEKACLLHDVGHAPFSHAGEDFYFGKTSVPCTKKLTPGLEHGAWAKRLEMQKSLAKAIMAGRNYKPLLAEFTAIEMNVGAAKPHEIMSAIIGMSEELEAGLDTIESRSFFARAICGYKYTDKSTSEIKDKGTRSFLSCLVELLNSRVIDVDKLDYLLRDAYLLGFDTVRVDYKRLLGSISIERIENSGEEFRVVYGKNAVSVLENVVYARDAERKWLQGHPVVLYDSHLLREAIVQTLKVRHLEVGDVFCRECLSGEGKTFARKSKIGHIRYLCDADVLYLMKESCSELAKRYFDRATWYKPIWKSEFEYRGLFSGSQWGTENIEGLFVELDALLAYVCDQSDGTAQINERTIQICKADVREYEDMQKRIVSQNNQSRARNISENLYVRPLHLALLNVFEKFAEEFHIPLDFVIVRDSLFQRGLGWNELDSLRIRLHSGAEPVEFGKVNNSLSSHVGIGERIFYLFCKKRGDSASAMAGKLSSMLQVFVVEKKKDIDRLAKVKEKEREQLKIVLEKYAAGGKGDV